MYYYIYGLSVFFPYPAFNITGTFGIQFAHILTIVGLYFNRNNIALKLDLLLLYFIIVIPPFISALFSNNVTINLNAAINVAIGVLPILLVPLLNLNKINRLMYGCFSGVLINGIQSVVQQVYYEQEMFPLSELYVNTSFSFLNDEALSIYYLYTKRSFGFFPEPSAAFASTAPFIFILVYYVLIKFFNLKNQVYYFLISAMIFGLFLLYFGRSGGLPYFVVACAIVVGIFARKSSRSVSTLNLCIALAMIFGFCYGMYQIYNGYIDRKDSELMVGGSWDERSLSIIFGLNAIFSGSIFNFLFGYGLGSVSDITYAATGATSVHSWIVSYFMGCGIVGSFCLFILFYKCLHEIINSDEVLLGVLTIVLWTIGATLVTGYVQLLPMWVLIGVFLSWRTIYEK